MKLTRVIARQPDNQWYREAPSGFLLKTSAGDIVTSGRVRNASGSDVTVSRTVRDSAGSDVVVQ